MTDIMTTSAEVTTEAQPIEVVEHRPAMIGILARAEAAEQAALTRVAELEAEVARLRTEQITDGGDPRLVDFWDKAGRIADYADFCNEYDRLAEELNGVPRVRDWDVTLDVTVTLRVNLSVSATTEEGACANAEENLDRDDVIEAVRLYGWDDITIDASAERS